MKHPGGEPAVERRKITDKTVNELCAMTGGRPAAFYRRMKEIYKIEIFEIFGDENHA